MNEQRETGPKAIGARTAQTGNRQKGGRPGRGGLPTTAAIHPQGEADDAIVGTSAGMAGRQAPAVAEHFRVTGLPVLQVPSSAPKSASPDATLLPVDVTVLQPITPLKQRIPEASEAHGAPPPQVSPINGPEILQPEAAVTVAIRTPDSATPEIQSAPVVAVQPSGLGAVGASVPVPVATDVTALAKRVPVSSPMPPVAIERKKFGALAPISAGDPVPARSGTSGTSVQDVPVKAGDTAAGDPVRRTDSRPSAQPAAEPVLPEQKTAQPLRSVSLEFTPDGARDVRVRLSERSGEVHVSLHSSDPAITKGLRDGVTDLAGVLAHAGIDAEAWSGGRQHRENPRQEQERSTRQSGFTGDNQNFDGMLQQPVQEIS